MSTLPSTALVLRERPGFGAGLRALFQGYRYLWRTTDLWPLAIVPMLVALVLALIFGAVAVKGALLLVASATANTGSGVLSSILVVVLQILAVLVALVVALFLAFALGKPLSGPVIERMVRRVSTDLGAPSWPEPTLIEDVWRSLQSTLVALAFTLPILVPLAILGFVFPAAAVVTTPLEFAVAAIAAAWDFCDYPLSIRGVSVAVRIDFVRRNIRAIMGFGFGLALLLLLPCTLLLVLPAGVVGAAHLTVAIEKYEETEASPAV